MDSQHFDNLTRLLAGNVSRRQVLKATVGTLLASIVPGRADAAQSSASTCVSQCDKLPPGFAQDWCHAAAARLTCTAVNIHTTTNTVTTGTCSNPCTTADLVVQAFQNADVRQLALYLETHGFEPDTMLKKLSSYILSQDGTLVRQALAEPFTNPHQHGATADLFFGVEATGTTWTYAIVFPSNGAIYALVVNNGHVQQIFPFSSSIRATSASAPSASMLIAAAANPAPCPSGTCNFFCGVLASLSCPGALALLGFAPPLAAVLAAACSSTPACSDLCTNHCECSNGLTNCSGLCFDTTSDPNNCGGCNHQCAEGQICIRGQCTCPAGESSCGADCCSATLTCCTNMSPPGCIDVTSDVNHCGDCFTICPGNQSCLNGQCGCPADTIACGIMCCPPGQVCAANGTCADCPDGRSFCGASGLCCPANSTCNAFLNTCDCNGPCPAGQTCCHGTCIATQTDNNNCGACGIACSSGQTCCNGTCATTQTDNNNCGGCGIVCQNGTTCIGGTCGCGSQTCAPGTTCCNGTCVNTQTDNNNCGACGNACSSGLPCTNGTCGCPTGQTLCGGTCVDTQTDSNNCGACGSNCGSTALLCCGGRCKAVSADANNCGACGNVCPGSPDGLIGSCCNSSCCPSDEFCFNNYPGSASQFPVMCCPYNLRPCNNVCTDLLTDQDNCGFCGNVCQGDFVCTPAQLSPPFGSIYNGRPWDADFPYQMVAACCPPGTSCI